MGTVRVDIEIESPVRPGERAVASVLVNTSAEVSWVPAKLFASLGIEHHAACRLRRADGSVWERRPGAAPDLAGEQADHDAFGEPGDLILLGVRSLEGLDLRLEPVNRTHGDTDSTSASPLPYTSILAPRRTRSCDDRR